MLNLPVICSLATQSVWLLSYFHYIPCMLSYPFSLLFLFCSLFFSYWFCMLIQISQRYRLSDCVTQPTQVYTCCSKMHIICLSKWILATIPCEMGSMYSISNGYSYYWMCSEVRFHNTVVYLHSFKMAYYMNICVKGKLNERSNCCTLSSMDIGVTRFKTTD